ncbi:MAG TPA: L-threonylcarbamoyladenylate synthase [Gemmatimonadales bacterium]|nr:L-threonylcarbamoyladenylate synthase [Gemmatimonadales bacterium]
MNPVPFQTPAEVEAALPEAVAHLRGGRLLAHPTETVYGLGSRANADGVRALADLKGREAGKPFLLLVDDRAMAEALGLTFTDAADALARAFWPGPLTLVLAGGRGLPDLQGPRGIAVRWTSHAGTARLVSALGEPLTSTSANRLGARPARDAREIMTTFADATRRLLLVLDGGPVGNSPPSTVVDCTEPAPRIVRAGALAAAVRTVARLAPESECP